MRRFLQFVLGKGICHAPFQGKTCFFPLSHIDRTTQFWIGRGRDLIWRCRQSGPRKRGELDGIDALVDFANRLERAVLDTIAANVSANLLGLGNAATPLGIQAARQMSRRTPGVASDELCMLVVCNTASIQLIPTTVAGVRQAAGCAAPFDILPAVWIASALSVCAGILAAKLLALFWPSAGPRQLERGGAER